MEGGGRGVKFVFNKASHDEWFIEGISHKREGDNIKLCVYMMNVWNYS